MNSHFDQVIDYIDQHLKANISEQQIREHFIKHGWSAEDVDKAFEEYSRRQQIAPQTLPAQDYSEQIQPPVTTNEQPQQPTSPASSYNHPAKYTFFDVLEDITNAIRLNRTAYLTSMAIITVAFVGLFALLSVLVFTQINIFYIFVNLAIVLLLFAVLASLAHIYQTFVLGIMTVLLRARFDNEKLGAFQPLKECFKYLRRLTLTNLLWNLITWGPLVAILAALLFAGTGGMGSTSLMGLLALMIPLWLLWILIISLRFCLSPVIAMAEPEIPVNKTLKRSQKLLGTRGQWLVVLGAIISVILLTIISNIETENTVLSLVQLVTMLLVLSYAFGGLPAIYFNRAAQKK